MGPTGNTPYGGDDFFASGPPGQPPAAPSAPSGPGAAAPGDRFGGFGGAPQAPGSAPVPQHAQFGAPAGTQARPGQFAVPGQAPPYPGAPGWAAPRKKGIPGWGKALIALGVVVGLIVIAAVAIPVFLAVRAQRTYDATSIAMPEAVGEYTRTNSDIAKTLEKEMSANTPGLAEAKAGLYTDPAGRKIVLVAGKSSRPMSGVAVGSQLDDVFVGFEKGGGMKVGAPATIPAGKLGGKVKCAPATLGSAPARACASADAAVVTSMIFSDPQTSDAAVTAAREAIEIRR